MGLGVSDEIVLKSEEDGRDKREKKVCYSNSCYILQHNITSWTCFVLHTIALYK